MNPNVNTTPATPVHEQPPSGLAGAEQSLQNGLSPEVAALDRGEHLTPPTGQPANDQPVMALPGQQPVQGMTPSGQPLNQQLTTPSAAADADSIEREWVLKAKEIVAATLQDPYQQNRQLAAIKADYMKKRYNKAVKLSD